MNRAACLLLSILSFVTVSTRSIHAAPSAPAKATTAPAPIIGHVHSADAGAMRLRDNLQSPLKAGDTIQSGDVVSTTEGTATLKLEDGAVKAAVRLKPATSARLQLTPGKGFETLLKRGSVFSDVHNPQKRPNPYQVRTNTAVMGVRGTIFFVKEEADSKSVSPGAHPTFLCACVGQVAVISGASKKEQLLTSKHHDRPVMLQAKTPGAIAEMTDAPMGSEHSDPEAAELENILAGAI